MTLFEVKLNSSPNQSSIIQIPIDGVNRVFKVDIIYREICGYWTMTITDWKTKEVILSNIPFVTGKFLEGAGNSLQQFAYKRIGKFGICRTTNDNDTDYPNNQNVSTQFTLFWEVD